MNLISIFCSPALRESVAKSVALEDRLVELLDIKDIDVIDGYDGGTYLLIDSNGIHVSPDWYNEMPPVLFPEATVYSPEALLGLIFCRLHNFEKAYEYLKNEPALMFIADIQNRLLHNVLMDESTAVGSASLPFERQHNFAIALLYGHWQQSRSAEEIERGFLQALTLKASRERKAFTVKHYGLFLIDTGRSSEAIELVQTFLQSHLSVVAQTEMKAVLCNAWMSQLVVPYDADLLEKLKTTLWECLQQYETQGRHAEAALLLIDASQVANISNSFSESLGYINRAIDILRKEELQELLGSAILRKGMLLYTWAQNGQPQFYRSALQALQDALLTFTRESAPDVFADIHHHLGVVYSEIQDEVKKKAVWAAVSVASFNEALNFYNKVDYPYEFAMICHNFGNAYTRYPAAIHSDNFDKALAWYREALDIRTAKDYPLERCNTLFNYLEASWLAANPSEAFNEDRFNEMWAMATELKALAYNNSLKQDADMQIEKLIQLRGAFSQTDIEPQHTNL